MVQTIVSQISSAGAAKEKEDVFTTLVGHIGKWQLIVFMSIFVVKFSSGTVQMMIIFLTPKTTFWCTDFNTEQYTTKTEVINNTCYDNCINYDYDNTPMNNTIISEWDLICKRQWLASFTQTILQLGILIGSIFFGFLSDRYGRKNTFLASVVLLFIFGIINPFSPNYTVFTILRFFLGIAVSGTMVVSFVIIMETVGPKYREILGCLFQIPFMIGHISVPIFAYYFRNWNSFSLAVGIPALIYFGYFFLVTESPRWLVSVGRVDEATKIMKNAALMNNMPTTKIHETLTMLSKEILHNKTDEPKLNYMDLIRTPSLRKRTICLFVMWLIGGLTFFGLNQYITQTSPDPFVSAAAAGAIQIPSNLLAVWLMHRFNRKTSIAFFFALGGVFVILLGVVPKIFWLTLTLGSLGTACGSIFNTAIYIYSSELFPTVARNMGMGVSSMSMRLGSMIAPFVANVNVLWLPTAIFGLAPLLAAGVCLMLPETKHEKLPDSINDVENDQ